MIWFNNFDHRVIQQMEYRVYIQSNLLKMYKNIVWKRISMEFLFTQKMSVWKKKNLLNYFIISSSNNDIRKNNNTAFMLMKNNSWKAQSSEIFSQSVLGISCINSSIRWSKEGRRGREHAKFSSNERENNSFLASSIGLVRCFRCNCFAMGLRATLE